MGAKCKWYAGRVNTLPDPDRGIPFEGLGTGIYEAKCLDYEPTERRHPAGWRYAIGPYSTRAKLKKAVRIPGATAIFKDER